MREVYACRRAAAVGVLRTAVFFGVTSGGWTTGHRRERERETERSEWASDRRVVGTRVYVGESERVCACSLLFVAYSSTVWVSTLVRL